MHKNPKIVDSKQLKTHTPASAPPVRHRPTAPALSPPGLKLNTTPWFVLCELV